MIQMNGIPKLVAIGLLLVIGLFGCSNKHGKYIEATDTSFQLGWGPNAIASGNVGKGGIFVYCSPSKEAMEQGTDTEWCAKVRQALQRAEEP